MLIIIMHNNQNYLDSLTQMAGKEGIKDITIVKGKGIGSRLIGQNTDFIFSKGKIFDAYDKAFVAVIKGEKKAKHFLNTIEQDNYLDRLNVEDKGFICAVPFHYIKHVELESASREKEETKMKITDFLTEDKILLDLKASNKEGAIKEIADVLRSSSSISDFDSFLKDIFEREALNTTAIGKHIAIPHARTDVIKEFVIAFGRCKKGMELNSLDNKPVKLIFLMGTPKEKDLGSYLQILACLTRILNKEEFREALLNASTPKEVIQAFRKIED